MTQLLKDLRIRQVSLVDKGASQRTFALLKRNAGGGRGSARNVRKDVPTFGTLQATRAIDGWWPGAIQALREVADAAIAPSDDPAVTPELRLNAIRGSWAQAMDELLELVATALGERATVDAVAKRRRGVIGLL